jgi:hypothetical protein
MKIALTPARPATEYEREEHRQRWGEEHPGWVAVGSNGRCTVNFLWDTEEAANRQAREYFKTRK